MPLNDKNKLPRGLYHLSGVAGVGMSALAEIMLCGGYKVTGSDREIDRGKMPEVVRKLVQNGLNIYPQDGSAICAETKCLIVSTAIETDNPEVIAAKKSSIPILHRAKALAILASGGKTCIAVSGTCGKSTVTGLIGFILEKAGFDPTVVNGARVVNWMTNDASGSVRLGKSGIWVVEADESDRSLMEFQPDWVVITNASVDHFGIEETISLFRQFANKARKGVVSRISPSSLLNSFSPLVEKNGSSFIYEGMVYKTLLPGRHNAENALLAVEFCKKFGVPAKIIAQALMEFKGIHRRLERIGEVDGITVMDDYAHNPAKIKAAWQAVSPFYGNVHAIWRPHGYGPLRKMMNDLCDVFSEVWKRGDSIILLPVYDAGGTADRSVSSNDLRGKLVSQGIDAICAEPDESIDMVISKAMKDDVILVMGARDPDLPAMCRKILSELQKK